MLNIQHFLNVCQKVGRRGTKTTCVPLPRLLCPRSYNVQYINGGRTIIFFFMCDYFVSRIIKNKQAYTNTCTYFIGKCKCPFSLSIITSCYMYAYFHIDLSLVLVKRFTVPYMGPLKQSVFLLK